MPGSAWLSRPDPPWLRMLPADLQQLNYCPMHDVAFLSSDPSIATPKQGVDAQTISF